MKPIKALLLEYLARHGDEPIQARSLIKRFKIPKPQRQEFEDTLKALLRQQRTGQKTQKKSRKPEQDERGTTAPGVPRGLISGIVRKSTGGAWFTPHPPNGAANAYLADRSRDDIFIYPEDLRDAHDGDEVVVRVLAKRRGNGRRCGRVEEVLGRSTNTFVGTYFEHEQQGFVRVDGAAFNEPVWVGDPGAKGVQPDDKVVIQMARFPTVSRMGEAVITELLGTRGDPGVDTKAVVRELGLPHDFSPAALAEAREQAAAFDENDLGDRTDLTSETIITIDPVDARDFDDAISLTRSDDGHWLLGVHVADVSHFVPAGGALDQEAVLRGTSVYLPGQVIPMLPEVISNNLASLQQGRVRLTKSVFIEFNEKGTPLHADFKNSAINVKHRFAYEEVMPLLKDPQAAASKVSPEVFALLGRMYELAMLLRKRRFEDGALELFLPEVKIQLDRDGNVSGAIQVAHDESHQIIEEFMLAANIAVATKLTDLGIKFLRRTHGTPDELKLKGFAEFVASLGFPLRQFHDRHQLQRLLTEVHGQPVEQAVNFALLRSMRQAEYTGEEDGHYALAVENYCHFTSPIRRYPDLTVHRLIDAVIRRSDRRQKIGARTTDVNKLGQHCSQTERRAAEAERQLIRVKLLRLLATKKGETFDAIITGIEKFGIFARCVAYPVDGMIPIEQLQKTELLDYDRVTRRLFSRRSGVAYQLGDALQVQVARIDPDARKLEWTLVAASQRPPVLRKESRDESRGPKHKEKRKPTRRSKSKPRKKS